MGIFNWFRDRRRKQLLAAPFPPAWQAILDQNVQLFAVLPADLQAGLRRRISIFVAEKNWEGVSGLKLTDEIKVTIAAQACVLTLGVEDFYFEHVTSILVEPTNLPSRPEMRGGIVFEDEESVRLGEMTYDGIVKLAWDEVLDDALDPQGRINVVYHEFAHHLDALNGYVDGVPPLGSVAAERHWQRVTGREYARLVQMSEEGRATLLDKYGASGPEEFFAVATECFFCRPAAMHRRHQELYETLQAFYRLDPRAWFPQRQAPSQPAESA